MDEVDVDVRSSHLMRLVENKEVFPNRQLPLGTPENLPTLDLTFDPTVRVRTTTCRQKAWDRCPV